MNATELESFMERAEIELDVLNKLGQGYDVHPAHTMLRKALKHIRSTMPDTAPPVPYDGIVAAYHLTLSNLPAVKRITPTRRTQMRKRWDEDKVRQDLAWWRNYFKRATNSDFLMGRESQSFEWRPDFDFFLQPKSMTKILEGAYGIEKGRTSRDEFADDVQLRQDARLRAAGII